MSLFDGAVPTFILTESIHDLCSKQIARVIKSNQWLKKEDTVMDFGCGIGSFSHILLEEIGFKCCLGIDSSEKMVFWYNEIAKENHLDNKMKAICRFINGPDELDGEKFDVIVSLKTFHHVLDPLETIIILKSYLKPHGRLVIADLKLDDHSPVYHRSVAEPPVCHGFTKEVMREVMEKAGFKVDVETVNVVHFLECLDCEAAKVKYDMLEPFLDRVDRVDLTKLPSMIQLGEKYFEKDLFPFLVACGTLV